MIVANREKRTTAPHLCCPNCHDTLGGIGVGNGTYVKSPRLHVRYYRCDRCEHAWQVQVIPEQILSVQFPEQEIGQ